MITLENLVYFYIITSGLAILTYWLQLLKLEKEVKILKKKINNLEPSPTHATDQTPPE